MTVEQQHARTKISGREWRFVWWVVAGILAVVHFIWLVKQGVTEPWIWAVVVAFLLLIRLKPIKTWVSSRSRRISRLVSRVAPGR